jgi:hypothetical protein
MMSDQFGIRFKMFPIVELIKLGTANVRPFGTAKVRPFGTATLNHYRKANTHSKVTKSHFVKN